MRIRMQLSLHSRSRAGVLPEDLLEPVAGPAYIFAFQRVGLRRGDENSLIGDGPPKGARRRERSLTRAQRAASGADLSQPNVGELSLKLRTEARASFDTLEIIAGWAHVRVSSAL